MGSVPGFWIRACAAVIDLVAITVVVVLAAQVAASLECYVPLEGAVLVAYCVYNVLLLSMTSTTVGKWLCGMMVTRRNGGRISLPVALIRALFQSLFLLLLGLPLLIVAARRSKRGWHDLLSGTQVEYIPNRATRRRWTVAVVSMLAVSGVASDTLSWARLYDIHQGFRDDAQINADKPLLPEGQIDAIAVGRDRNSEIAAWLAAESQEPGEYLIKFAAQHQVTIVGEIHGKRQFLEFFSDAIARLYHEAGVRVIALEYCTSNQDAELARLVTADEYDSDLALEIARRAVWRAWGYKEYWDVLESVWRLNRSLSEDAEALRVIGIFPPVDVISIGLFKAGHGQRLFRVLGDLPMLAMADAFYARCVERQAFDSGKRTLVWVGAGHSWKCCSAQQNWGDGVKRHFRMGAMLRGRYGSQIGTIILHNDYSFPTTSQLVETARHTLGKTQLGFDIAGSPLASLRENQLPWTRSGMALPLGRYGCGYVVVAPLNKIESCQWWDGFITPRMFGLYRPFYEALCERSLKDHEEANLHMREGVHRI
jgi:uncharacterized RDD family membrane protein YckC